MLLYNMEEENVITSPTYDTEDFGVTDVGSHNTNGYELLIDDAPQRLRWFDCLGDLNVKDHRLGNCYVSTGEIKALFESALEPITAGSIKLFGASFDQGSALLSNSKLLFQMARKDYLIILRSATNAHLRLMGPPAAHNTDVSCGPLRRGICELMSYVRRYLTTVLKEEECAWMLEEVIQSVTINLTALRLLLKCIADLPDHVVNYTAYAQGNKCSFAAYHLMHLHLDLRWTHITLLHRLAACQELLSCDVVTDTQQDVQAGINTEGLEQHIQMLLDDLTSIAITRFERLSVQDLGRKAPFACSCVKELWLLLQLFVDKYHEQGRGNNFWWYINRTLNTVLARTPPKQESQTNCSILAVVDSFTCTNPVGFNLWMLTHLAQLYGYSEEGTYVGPSCSRVVDNSAQLEKVLKTCMSPEATLSETQLRAYLPLVATLVTVWWQPKSDAVMILWEYFHHRFNSYFFLQGATPDTLAVVSKSGASLMRQVLDRLESPTTHGSTRRTENSFELFLRLLGTHLQRSPLQWRHIKGRVYSKLSPAKMHALKEIGIYHFSSLFLTLAATTNLQEVGSKMQDQLRVVTSSSGVDAPKHLMVWKSHLALLQLCVEKGVDIANVVKPLLNEVLSVSLRKDTNAALLLRTFIEGFQDIVDSSETLKLSEYTLLDGWVTHFLSPNSIDPRQLLEVALAIMNKLQTISQRIGAIEYDAANSQLTKMYMALCEHLLPFIKAQFNCSAVQSPSQVADVAAAFTFLTLDRANVGVEMQPFLQLFNSFVANADAMNANMTIRYLCHVLKEESVITELNEVAGDYHVIVVQAWVRCCVFSLNGYSEELMDLTQVVSRLPGIVQLCEASSTDLVASSDPLSSFIKMLGHSFHSLDSMQSKMEFRAQCCQYLAPSVKSFEPVLKNAAVSESVVYRICQVAACMVVHCGPIIYTRTNAYCLFNIIVKQLLLPIAIFKPETQIHPFLANALSQTLHMFIRGIASLGAANDNTLSNTLKNLVIQYFTRLLTRPSDTPKPSSGLSHSHPLLCCFDEGEDKELAKFVLETITTTFLKMRDPKSISQTTSLALMFILDLLFQKNFSENTLDLVIHCTLSNILEVVIFGDMKNNVLKRQAVNILKILLSKRINSNALLSESFVTAVMSVTEQHVSLYSTYVFAMLSKLCELVPDLMSSGLPRLKSIVVSVEQKRGVSYDPMLRNGLERVEKILQGQPKELMS